MRASHEKNKKNTKITFEILHEWNRNNIFPRAFRTNLDGGLDRVLAFQYAKDTCLNTYELIILFRFLYVFQQGSNEYQQILEALHEAFIFDNQPFLPTIMQTMHEDNMQSVEEQLSRLIFIMHRFITLTESPVIKELKVYGEALDLLIDFGRITPCLGIKSGLISVCNDYFSPCPNETLLSQIEQKGFRYTFISLFLNSHTQFHKKIHASPKVVPIASCVHILQNLNGCPNGRRWNNNMLNLRLLSDHPEKAEALYAIFSQLRKYPSIFTEAMYQKVMHPAVLNNLDLFKEAVFSNPVLNNYEPKHSGFPGSWGKLEQEYTPWSNKLINLLDGIIACDLFYQMYPLLLNHLPKDIVIQIFNHFFIQMHTVPLQKLTLSLMPDEKRIVLPLSDSVVEALNEDDIEDIQQAFSCIDLNEIEIFSKLSVPGMNLLLHKLGENFVKTQLFTLDYNMLFMLEKMSNDCQKAFYDYLGSDYIWSILIHKYQTSYMGLMGMKRDQFGILLSMFDVITYLTEHVARNAPIQECYLFLNKIHGYDKALCEEALEKLGREWLIKTNKCAADLGNNLNTGNTDLQLSIIKKLGSEPIQKLLYSFGEIVPILQMLTPDAQKALFELAGSAHLAELIQNPNVANFSKTLHEAFLSEKYNNHKILDILQIDSQFLLKIFKTPLDIWTFHHDDEKFILHLNRIGPVHKDWLDNPLFISELLSVMPTHYYETFIEHLTITNTVPSWDAFYFMQCKDKVALYKAMPESWFVKNPMNVRELGNVVSDAYLLCLEKMSVESLKSIVNSARFHISVPRQYQIPVCTYLFEKLGKEYLQSLSVHEDLYRWLCILLPVLKEKNPVMDNHDETTQSIQLSASRDILFVRPNPANAHQEGEPLYENKVTR